MIESSGLLSASDFMNYDYCPRIIYFTYTLKRPQTKGAKQEKGLEKDREFKKTERTKIIKKYEKSKLTKIYNVTLQSNLGIITKADCIAIDFSNKSAFPVQLKYSYRPPKVYRTQKIQLLLEGFLIEEVLHYRVDCGYIKYLKSNELVRINLEDKHIIFELMSKIKSIIQNEIIPEPTEFKNRCIDCCYRRICYG
ncbi:CRISPR-associated protein Cas4 [Candidatus Woesearchaeota archaeon CG07_land_8_20_14_0_80_44_23]|nr:MAG: CRISPR-associated protein Cas4 [Candidatus Woesearchaeota archaeon CG07_land_8_20_14_0_80_44_23]QBM01460.1 CRISPR-associated exonuclease Cas4 [uncultured archaeon]